MPIHMHHTQRGSPLEHIVVLTRVSFFENSSDEKEECEAMHRQTVTHGRVRLRREKRERAVRTKLTLAVMVTFFSFFLPIGYP